MVFLERVHIFIVWRIFQRIWFFLVHKKDNHRLYWSDSTSLSYRYDSLVLNDLLLAFHFLPTHFSHSLFLLIFLMSITSILLIFLFFRVIFIIIISILIIFIFLITIIILIIFLAVVFLVILFLNLVLWIDLTWVEVLFVDLYFG